MKLALHTTIKLLYIVLIDLKTYRNRTKTFCQHIFVVTRWAELQKEDNGWMKKHMEYEAEGARPRGRPKKTWTEVVQKDCHARKLNREDAMDRSR